jgi:nitrate reductase / nitrite oxidoreductase, alpha subunit
MNNERQKKGIGRLSRRKFLKLAGVTGFLAVAGSENLFGGLRQLKPVAVANPLAQYPNRGWERIYRDMFKTDSSFTFLCAPNDTHNCLLRAYVKNDVVVRIEPSYGYGKAQDLHGNKASHRWDPRACQKGLILGRRIYGDRRVNGAYIRKGFKEWVDGGFQRDPETGAAPKELMNRGFDSWIRVTHQQAYEYHAKTMDNIARTYSGEQGKTFLKAQGYDPDMIEAMDGAGTRTLKFRGGMALLGAVRLFGHYRLANSMALLDAKVRGVSPEQAKGGGGYDSYTWHTDLPPGHPMVSGEQTNDFELHDTEHSKLIIAWGMNWIATKMPDSHWLTEARMKGARTVAVTVEYSATASKCDDVIVIRPGTDPAFALGLSQVMIAEGLYNKDFVKKYTDLPTLVRMDNLQPLRAADIFEGHTQSTPANWTTAVAPGQTPPRAADQSNMYIPAHLRDRIHDFVMWDSAAGKPVAVTRDQMGEHFDRLGIDPALEGRFEVETVDGTKIEVRTVFDLTRQYLDDNMTPEQVEKLTWAPARATRDLARRIAASEGKTLAACGMGPNQFFNNDLKDRAIWLTLALAGSLGNHGGNIGSYAGNYKATVFGGVPLYVAEDPFHPQTDENGDVRTRSYLRYESLHYWANDERLMKAGNKTITQGGHVPTPSKAIWQANSNSSLGNIKGHYDVVFNTLPRCELMVYSEWWWTGSCEYSDIVYGVDSWAEMKHPDMTASNTNPFLQVYPDTPLARVGNTVSDHDTLAGVAAELARITGDSRFNDMFKFIRENRADVYLQRILDGSAMTRGYRFKDVIDSCRRGTPALMNSRTYPRINSYEQVHESRPWYTKTGRLEFYRPEVEFIEAGENLIVHREPSDSTFYEPCVIVGAEHPALKPKRPADWGFSKEDLSHMTRQMRNETLDVEATLKSKHPLLDREYRHIFHTPKYRHGSHTTPIDTDYMQLLFGPFGDIHRRDKRMPGIGEMYVDIHPEDAKALGVQDGDYVWIDGDPADLPFRGWQNPDRREEYKVARLMARARYYPGTPRGVTRMWFNGYMATPGSVEGHETREDGLAKNPETNYQSMFRYGGHQSLTRTWLKPTHQTQTLVYRALFGHVLGSGFAPDVHCVGGAPREAMAKITKAEDGGIGGVGVWRPVQLGFRPSVESERMKRYLEGKLGS